MAHSHQNFCSVSPLPGHVCATNNFFATNNLFTISDQQLSTQRRDVMVIEEAWKILDFNYIISYLIISYYTINIIIFYKNPMPSKIQLIRGQDCLCIFCGMQQVIFHSSFPPLLLQISYRGPLRTSENTLQNISSIANVSKQFLSCPEIFS